MPMQKEKRLFKEDVFPSLEHMRRTGHRVTYEEHVRRCLAAGIKPRMGRPPKGADRNEPISIRIPPAVLSALRDKAQKKRMGYQTLIVAILTEEMGLW